MIAQALPEEGERLDTIFEEGPEDIGEEAWLGEKYFHNLPGERRRPVGRNTQSDAAPALMAPTRFGQDQTMPSGHRERALDCPQLASTQIPATPGGAHGCAQEAKAEPRGAEKDKTGDFLRWPYWSTGIAPTTLELTSLPHWMTSELLCQQLDHWGFRGRYNFVHSPVAGGRSLGHASVNAVTHGDGLAIARFLYSFRGWRPGTGSPPCRVGWNLWLQGLDQLILDHQQSAEASDSAPWVWTGTHWSSLQCTYWWPQWC